MKTNKIILTISCCLFATACVHDPGISQPADPRVVKMSEMHLKMSDAHRQMAQCLAQGQDPRMCHEALVAACARIGMGAPCGASPSGQAKRGPGAGMMWHCPMLPDAKTEAGPPQSDEP